MGGFSGGPVFDLPGPRTVEGNLVIKTSLSCYGIIHGTLSDDTGGKLAAVTPSAFILETIAKAEKEAAAQAEAATALKTKTRK